MINLLLTIKINKKEDSAKLRSLRAKNLLVCQRVLRAYVLKCQRVLRAYVLTCLRTLRAYMLSCQRANASWVLTCSRVNVPSSITLTLFIYNPNLWIRENVQCIFVWQLYPDFVVLLFIFTSFDTTSLILLVKIISSQSKVTNSGGLMLVCRWASINDPVQNKFRSIIHLLSQHLLA